MTLAMVAGLALPMALAPRAASAGFFDFLFGNNEPARAAAPAQPQSDAFADPAAANNPAAAPSMAGGGRFTAYCVRSCDGRYFPLSARGSGTPAQMCQSFCPASPTKVFSGNSIDYAVGPNGERYVDSANAFLYRKTLKADCTCNGRDPTGLAPVDLSLDSSLRPGDVIATANGLVAYSGSKTANGQTADFTPVANYPGLTADVRARLGEMKVAPVAADISEDTYSAQDTTGSLSELKLSTPPSPAPKIAAPKSAAPKTNRTGIN